MIVRPTRRDILRHGSLAVLAALPAPAIGQAWPNKPIKIIVTYPAGGLTDIFARAYGEYVGQKVGQPVVVENKTGAAGAIGAEMVKQAPADGYTLMFTNSTTMVQNKRCSRSCPTTPTRTSRWLPGSIPATCPPSSTRTCRPRRSRSSPPGRVTAHVVAETLNRHYGLKMEAVHYRGEALMWQDVASGAVQGASGSYASAGAVLQSGAGRPIAVPTLERMKKLPAVPTFVEQGLMEKAFQVRGWVGCCAPAATPEEIVLKLSDLMVEAGKTERIQKIIDTFGIDEAARERAYFRKVLDEEGPVVIDVIKSLNIEPQ
jgi:tripartite-type tricarboxylate transporter receptor subunit TctC